MVQLRIEFGACADVSRAVSPLYNNVPISILLIFVVVNEWKSVCIKRQTSCPIDQS